jgi:hypothetical protein
MSDDQAAVIREAASDVYQLDAIVEQGEGRAAQARPHDSSSG